MNEMNEENREIDIKVTLLLPSLNVAEYISQCLESAMGQTLKELEILCIDAGSDDGTVEIIREYTKKDPRIRLLPATVRSYGYQMNLGIREARGEYIGIIETDDYVDSDMYEILYERAVSVGPSSPDVVKALLYDRFEYADGSAQEILQDYISADRKEGQVFCPEDYPDVHIWDGNIWNGIYKTSFLKKNGIRFRETRGAAFQDIGFQQRVLNAADSVMYLRYHFYHYRKVRPGASTWNPKCVRFIYGEYQSILEDNTIRASRRKYILIRMAPSFLYEIEKALCYADFDVESLECPEAIEWFSDTLQKAFHEMVLTPEDFPEELRDEVLLFLVDRELYIRRYQDKMHAVYHWYQMLKERLGERELVLYGAGRYGMNLLLFLPRNGIPIRYLADVRKDLIQTSFYGLPVQSPDDATRNCENKFYLIANKKVGEQISEEIQKRGVPKEQIMVFDGQDQALVGGIRKQPILVWPTGSKRV